MSCISNQPECRLADKCTLMSKCACIRQDATWAHWPQNHGVRQRASVQTHPALHATLTPPQMLSMLGYSCSVIPCPFPSIAACLRAQESFHYLRYKASENTIYLFADDAVPRHLTGALTLDFDTIAGGDKFGNIFIVRIPADISAQVQAWPHPTPFIHV